MHTFYFLLCLLACLSVFLIFSQSINPKVFVQEQRWWLEWQRSGQIKAKGNHCEEKINIYFFKNCFNLPSNFLCLEIKVVLILRLLSSTIFSKSCLLCWLSLSSISEVQQVYPWGQTRRCSPKGDGDMKHCFYTHHSYSIWIFQEWAESLMKNLLWFWGFSSLNLSRHTAGHMLSNEMRTLIKQYLSEYSPYIPEDWNSDSLCQPALWKWDGFFFNKQYYFLEILCVWTIIEQYNVFYEA